MAKHSNFARSPRDLYPTPLKGALPLTGTIHEANHDLLDHPDFKPMNFIEPFAGNGALTDHLCLSPHLSCVYESDIEPQNSSRIVTHGYEHITEELCDKVKADWIISNPPWLNTKASGFLLFSLIEHLANLRPTALLLDGGFAFNVGSAPYMRYCKEIIPVGRLKWIPDSKYTGTEDCAWFLFDANKPNDTNMPNFHPRKKWNLPNVSN